MIASITKPVRKDYSFVRGNSFFRSITVKFKQAASTVLTPLDLTGYTAEVLLFGSFPIRHGKVSTGSMNVVIPAPETQGIIEFSMPTSVTEALPAKSGYILRVYLTADPENATHDIMEGVLEDC